MHFTEKLFGCAVQFDSEQFNVETTWTVGTYLFQKNK